MEKDETGQFPGRVARSVERPNDVQPIPIEINLLRQDDLTSQNMDPSLEAVGPHLVPFMLAWARLICAVVSPFRYHLIGFLAGKFLKVIEVLLERSGALAQRP